ncbi:hypothetical protein Q5425_26450 [Amycolatopsis sp. A133]|uniref:hypothetical protein n=1 Tax=Amycolatopsis sp. A133 TaxID=3064472 RepID=UPI0027EC345F|nr:hypothetical protein [Amycolatopsis sp. A133]MDQ7807292.1 hypothetical protein [Amycolatopsis sp. A133]
MPAPDAANLLHLQRTAGNSALANSISRLRDSAEVAGPAVQRSVAGPGGILRSPVEIFALLGVAAKDEWETAAAKSMIDDHIVRTATTAAGLDGVRSSLAERVKLAQAIISIANNGILTKEDRERKQIRAQQSIDMETAPTASKISVSQSETGATQDATQVAGLLEHQAMSVRMEKYVEEGGRQVPEKWQRPDSFRPDETGQAKTSIAADLEMPLEAYEEERKGSRRHATLEYLAVMKSRGESAGLKKLLAERAANSAIFGGPTETTDAGNRSTFAAMGLDRPKEGSHEVRVSRSMPAGALEFILLPRCLYAFDSLLRAHIKTDLTLHYVDGTHQVRVSWVPMIGMPQLSFEIESPDWKQGLKEILEKEKRIFAHVTRPLQEPAPPPPLPPRFMTSKAMKPLTPEELLLAAKVMGKRRAERLPSLGML